VLELAYPFFIILLTLILRISFLVVCNDVDGDYLFVGGKYVC